MLSDGWVPGQAGFTFLPKWGGGERTEAVQKAKLRDVVCLPSDISLPAAEMAMMGRCISPPPPCAMGCNRNRPDINTTTVGGRGGTGGLCIPVVIAPVTAGQKGGGVGKWTSVTPRGRKPIFPHPYGHLWGPMGTYGDVSGPPGTSGDL